MGNMPRIMTLFIQIISIMKIFQNEISMLVIIQTHGDSMGVLVF